jgi:transcriptional regulator with XRE-family HTH domain
MTASTPKQTERPLRIVRQAQGLSLRKAADRAGLDPGHLSRVERGQGGLSLDSLARLASVLGLRDLERLLSPYRANNNPGNDDGPAGDRAAKERT